MWPRLTFMSAFLLTRGRAARRQGRYADAAPFYEEASRLRPGDGKLRIQCGHMRKEAGDLAAAEAHYIEARRLRPRDAELALQIGHFLKTKGAILAARESYARAAELRPGWVLPLQELAGLPIPALPVDDADPAALEQATPDPALATDFAKEAEQLARQDEIALLVPALVPRKPHELLFEHGEHIEIRRLGRREPSFWGLAHTLRGVEALRGYCVSKLPILEVQLIMNAVTMYRGPLKGGYALPYEPDKARVRKYVFNIWFDFSVFVPGRHRLELRFTDAAGETRAFHDTVVVAPPLVPEDHPFSDGIIAMTDPNPASLQQRIRALPSVVHPARRELFPDGVRNVLVLRTDQLGDMVASIPALQRLREIVPGARIVGLLTGANAELARTLDLFDEIIVVEFPDDARERRRLMPLAAQEALRARLADYKFDIAIELANSNVSRELLQLTGARFTHGVGGGDWPWMSSQSSFHTHDRWTRQDMTPHSSKVLAVVETLGTVLRNVAPVMPREDLSRELLEPFGLAGGERYAVLHAGARIAFSRWPKYPQLAHMLLERTDLHVVLISEDKGFGDTLPPDLLANERVRFIGERLSFDQFDALISFATVMAGNDSGPKHLAALRGTNVVTLFTARINWAEWGQENVGSIIARRVPCQGCLIFHDAEECGQDWTCIRDIGVEEVFDAMAAYL